MIDKVGIERFLALSKEAILLDVRSPGEYEHAHIPSAISIPLFSNDERKVVGTTYKQESRETAIKIGLDYFGPKMRTVVEEVELLSNNGEKQVLVHCWRGGMRSGAVAWLLDLYGFKVTMLEGGYKAYRNWVISWFQKEHSFKIVGGYTGSAKTVILKHLNTMKLGVIDLEGLANHQGSALGGIGMGAQPSQEMFENKLAHEMNRCKDFPAIWLEDESQRIGNLQLPHPMYKQMQKSEVYFLDIPFEKRLEYLTVEYGKLDRAELKAAVKRITKRLGGLETKKALRYLEEENIKGAFSILLKYYDKYYLKGLKAKEKYVSIKCDSVDALENTKKLKEWM